MAVYGDVPRHTLTVQSSPDAGAQVAVTPNDVNGQGDGTTEFTRVYEEPTVVTLTAPATLNLRPFVKWTVDGGDHATTLQTQVTMDADHTAVAVYGEPGQECTASGGGILREGVGRATLFLDVAKDANGNITKDTLRLTRIRPRQLLISTGINSVNVVGNTATIQGTCTINRQGGYTYTVTVTDAAVDSYSVLVQLVPPGKVAPPHMDFGGNIYRGDFVVTGGGPPTN